MGEKGKRVRKPKRMSVTQCSVLWRVVVYCKRDSSCTCAIWTLVVKDTCPPIETLCKALMILPMSDVNVTSTLGLH